MQKNLEVTVGSGDALDVRHFNADAEMSRPFVVDIVAVCDSATIDFDAIIGAPASFSIATLPDRADIDALRDAPDGRRVFSGICAEVRQMGVEQKGGLSTYRLRLLPTLSLLGHRTNNRIFQYKSEVEIALQILSEWRIAVEVRVDLAAHKRRKYKVQYEESDLAFVNRMLEEAGVAYFFDTGPSTPGTMVLVENPERGERRLPALRFFDEPNLDAGLDFATNLQIERRVAPGRYTVRDHDYRLAPSYRLAQTSESGIDIEKKLEIYDYVEGAFLFTTGDSDDSKMADRRGRARTNESEGKRLASRRLEALRAESLGLWFETNAYDIGVGSVVTITDHPRTEKVPLLVVAMHASGGFEGNVAWSCEATSALGAYRPPLRTPRPVANGVESAVVVGPPGEEIHCDEFGRVKVHFHWDRESRMDDDSSCWIHVSQPWGGAGFGGSQLPRVGQEVLVEFLGGDPDRPVIVGRVYTALQTTPYALPANKTQSGLKSNSTGGTGGWNEIMMEDKAGSELLRLRAQKDLTVFVGHNWSTTVVNDCDLDVGVNLTRTVGGDETNRVTGQRITEVKGFLSSKVTEASTYTSKSITLKADKEDIFLSATTNINANAPKIGSVADEIHTIRCGASRIYITPWTIAMDAPTVLINPGGGMMDYVAVHGGPPAAPQKPLPPGPEGSTRPQPPAKRSGGSRSDNDANERHSDEVAQWKKDNAEKIAAWDKYDKDMKEYDTQKARHTQQMQELSNSSRYRPPGYEYDE